MYRGCGGVGGGSVDRGWVIGGGDGGDGWWW